MRLLVYGGCHALILKRLIDELGPPGAHAVDCLINFQVIATGEPFPVERLPGYDAVIYSPVENKGDYNTVHLHAACAAAGVPAVAFPWLEWHGHAPGADKDAFWGHRGWYFPELVEAAADFGRPEDFVRYARAALPTEEAARKAFAHSTAKLVEQEERADCAVRVSGFILDGYRDRRMFLIPDHPTLIVYRHVLEQLERLLGTRLIASWPADLPEPQPEERTPILPRVAAITGLAFADSSWACETQPLAAMELDAYLALHFHLGRRAGPAPDPGTLVLATARRPTWIVAASREPGEPGPVPVPLFAQVLLRRSDGPDARGHFEGEVVAAISRGAAGAPSGRRLFREEDWLCRR